MSIALNNPGSVPTPRGHYSHAAKANGFLFISGQLPIDSNGQTLQGESFETQVSQIFANIDVILQSNGASRDHLVQVRVYITDIANWPEFNTLYSAWIGHHKPARAVVPVPELHYGSALEIEATAAL